MVLTVYVNCAVNQHDVYGKAWRGKVPPSIAVYLYWYTCQESVGSVVKKTSTSLKRLKVFVAKKIIWAEKRGMVLNMKQAITKTPQLFVWFSFLWPKLYDMILILGVWMDGWMDG